MYPYTIHLPDLKTEKITLGNKCRLKNFYRIGDGVYRSDQPSAACFRELEKFGMREILNLRCYHTDTKEAQGTSLILHHLPTRAIAQAGRSGHCHADHPRPERSPTLPLLAWQRPDRSRSSHVPNGFSACSQTTCHR